MIYHKSFLKLDEKKRHMAAEYDIPQIIPKVENKNWIWGHQNSFYPKLIWLKSLKTWNV